MIIVTDQTRNHFKNLATVMAFKSVSIEFGNTFIQLLVNIQVSKSQLRKIIWLYEQIV